MTLHCRYDVYLTLQVADAIYVVCELSSKHTVPAFPGTVLYRISGYRDSHITRLRGRTPNILQYISVFLHTHTKCMAEHVFRKERARREPKISQNNDEYDRARPEEEAHHVHVGRKVTTQIGPRWCRGESQKRLRVPRSAAHRKPSVQRSVWHYHPPR